MQNYSLSKSQNQEVLRQGVRFEDLVQLSPAYGKSEEMKLTRTQYDFTLVADEEIQKTKRGDQKYLPKMGAIKEKFRLTLVRVGGKGEMEDEGRYYLSSVGGAAFRINGIYSTGAWVMRGDRIDLGFNRLEFSRPRPRHERLEQARFERLYSTNLSLLVLGETGVGKTHLARQIHEQSGRIGSFVHLNLSSFSSSLLESELFGHVKGAFTGANQSKLGAIREAKYGTLFLDEVDSLSYDLQTKLLLFLEDHKVRPVGDSRSYECDVRLIFASGQSLEELVKQGKMRKDFYFRLTASGQWTIPPLREQPELIEKICYEFEQEQSCVFDRALVDFYKGLKWPGNIRELRSHLLKKKLMSNSGRLTLCPMDDALDTRELHFPCKSDEIIPLNELKGRYCRKVLRHFEGNVGMTSSVLKVSPNTVRALVQKSA